jgi:hypothetical protein
VHSKTKLLLALHTRRDARFSYSIFKYYKQSQNDRNSASFAWRVTKGLLRPVNLEMVKFVDVRKGYAQTVRTFWRILVSFQHYPAWTKYNDILFINGLLGDVLGNQNNNMDRTRKEVVVEPNWNYLGIWVWGLEKTVKPSVRIVPTEIQTRIQVSLLSNRYWRFFRRVHKRSKPPSNSQVKNAWSHTSIYRMSLWDDASYGGLT